MEQQNTGFQSVSGQPSSPGIAPDPQIQRSVNYQAQFSPERQQPMLQYPAPAAPTQPLYTPTPAPTPPTPVQPPAPQPEQPTPPQEEEPDEGWRGVHLSPAARRIAIIVAGILLLLGMGITGFVLWRNAQQTATADPVNSAIGFDIQQLPLNEISSGALPTIQGSRKMSINGQLEVKSSLIIAPTGQPTSAVAGQIYYDQDTNVLSYFNGSEFVNVVTADKAVTDLGGSTGSISVGAGLSSVAGQLTNTGVIELQTSGPLTSSGGQNPNVTFANGTANGQFWQWDGDSWELATLPQSTTQPPSGGDGGDGDTIIGNEVTDVITGGGLILRGAATAVDPLKVSLEACAMNEVLKSNGNGGWACATDAGGVSYSAGNGLNLDNGTGTFSVNSPTCGGTDKLQWNGNAFVCSPDVDTNTTYSAGTGMSLTGTTFNNTGTLNVTGSGAITSTGGQTPNLAFANGTTAGQFWQWDGSAWVLALLSGAADTVIGNEVLNAISGQGLTRSGSGTALDPFTLGLQSCTDGQILKNTGGTGWACAADGTGGGISYTADGQGIELTGTTFSLELDSTSLSKSATGLRLNTANANTWTATQTYGAGLVVSAGQSVSVNGDVITDMTGTGLTVAGGSLQTTLGVSVDLGSEVVGTLPIANGGTNLTSLGTAHQLLGVNGAGSALEYKNIGSLIGGGTGISVSGTNTVTISNSGVLSVAGSGPITSTGGQAPSVTFADGTANGQFWQWNGSAWALAFLPAEQDAVIGNEVVGGTGSNSGLTRTGTGTGGNPYTLSVNTGSGLQVTSNVIGVNSPTCAGTDKLQWDGSAFVCSADVDTDTNTTYSTISNGGLRLVGTQFGLGICSAGQLLKATSTPGEYACANDADTDTNTSYFADGQGIELTGTTFGLELNGTSLSKSTAGLTLNLTNANTWTGAQTFNAGATIGASQSLTVNGDAFTDLTGTGLTINTGSLQTTLGTSVDLTTEVVGTLPVGNGGTGLTALGTSNQLLGVNAGGTALEYKNLSSILSAGTGIGLSGTNSITVSNNGILSIATSGPITSTGGQAPTLTFANGDTAGQFWQWDGDSWELASLPTEQDGVVGNEVTNVTGVNSGLVRSGAGTAGDPYTLAVNPGNGLQVTSNALGINSPTCTTNEKLLWNGTAFECAADADSDTNTTYSTISNGGLRLVGTQFGLSVCAAGQILKATAVSGEYECADDTDSNTTYSADGQGIELTGQTFGLELNGTTLTKSTSGLALNLANANTWTGRPTFAAGATVSTGEALTVNGDAFSDLTGTGLTINTGSLQTTLGTSVDLTSEVVGTLPVGNGGTGLTALGTSNQLLGVNAAGTSLEYKNLSSILSAGTGIGLSGTNTVTVTNNGVLSVAGSGPITSTGGQTPSLTFADGTTAGQFWQWDGDSWELASLPAEQDSVVGNEVTNVTGVNSGLVRSGSGTNGSPYTLAVNPGNGLQIASNALGINSPTCSGTDKLQWTGTAFICSPDTDTDTDTNTTYTALSNGGLRLVGTQFGLGVCTQNQIMKATSVSGEWACAADTDTDTNTTYTADGQGIELTGTTFSLELNGTTLAKSASGLNLNLSNANTWAALQTFSAGATVSAGQTLTVNGDAFTDLTGTGLTISGGALQSTLGTSVSLTSEVTGTLPIANGGTNLTALGSANQLMGVNAGGTALEYKNIASLLTAGTGISLSGTTNATINNTGVLTVAGSGPISSTGGQNPTVTFANGSSTGQFWQWNGSAWALSSDVGTSVSCNVGGNFACMGGNTPGSTMTLGTNNAQSLAFETNNTAVATIGTDGATTFKNSTNSTAAFLIQNASSNNVLSIDTTTPNMLSNPSLEVNTTGWVAATGNTAGDPTLTRDTTQAFFGAASLKIATNADINEGARYAVTLAPSTQYTFTFHAKVGTGTATTINMGRADVSGTDINCLTAQTLTVNWARYTCTFTTGGTITSSYLYIKQSDASARNIFIDGVQVQTGSSATPYREGAIAMAAPLTIGALTPSSNSYGLTIRGYGEQGLNNNTLFAIQNSAGIDRVTYHEQYGRLSVTGGNSFWGSAAMEVISAETNAVGLRVQQISNQTADAFQLQSSAPGSPVRFSVGAGDYTDTSGTKMFNVISPNFNPTSSSTATFVGLAVNPIVNFAGGGAGNSTALLVNPTYTAAGGGTNLLADFQNGGTSVMSVSRTGAVVHKTTTDSTSGFNIVDSGNASTFNVDTINNRVGVNNATPQTALDVNGAIQQTGMWTPDTAGVDANKWTKLGACNITAQYQLCAAVINILGGTNGVAAGNTQATISARVKQQDALGNAPLINVTLNNTAQVITSADVKAVTTQNNGAGTIVELWVRNTTAFERFYYTPTLNIDSNGQFDWTPETAYAAALPAGTQTTTVYGDTYANTLTVQPAANSLTSFVVKASVGGGGNEIMRVDTTNERVAIGVVAGAPSAKLHVATGTTVGMRVYQSGSSDALQLANATADFLTVSSTGATMFKNTTNSTNAFRILNAGNVEMLSVDTTNGRVTVGKVASATSASAKLYIGDYGSGVGNVFIGESAESTDSDVLELHGLSGLTFTVNDSAGDERMRIENDGVNILGTGSLGSEGLLYFGDFGNATIGEWGTGDTDALQLNGRLGIYMAYDGTDRVKLDTAGLTISDNINTPTKQYRMRTNGGSLDFEAGGANMYFSNWSGADFTGTQYTGLILYSGQSRMDVKSSYTYFTPTTNPAGNMVDFNRTTAGTILGFALNGTIQGSISISGTTVSYNAFTGSHYTWSEQNLERGQLVRMTGDNKSRPGQEDSTEPTYGVERTTTANDPAAMGTYLGRMNPDLPFDLYDNANLVAAVGNGDMWVVDDGENVQPGDFLISSDTAGHAMKDRGQFPTSNVIARAAQSINWSSETQMIGGKKHRKISVLYGSFQKTNLSAFQQGVWSGGLVANDATFNGFVTFNGGVKFNGDATFDGNVAFNKNVTFSSNTAGTVTIPAGQKTVTITFSREHTEKPVVNITPEEFVSGSYRVKEVAKDKFIVELSQAQSADVHFNWSALSAAAAN